MRYTTNEEAKTMTIAKINTNKCAKLRVREDPNLDSKILKVLSAEDEVTIDLNFKNPTFYKVTSGNITGYCVKLYLKIQK